MKLKQYLDQIGMTQAAFGKLIGVSSRETVARYIAGERTPRRDVMEKIAARTNGAVTPNDFHEIAPMAAPEAEAA